MDIEIALKCLFAAFLVAFFVATYEPPKMSIKAGKAAGKFM